MGIIKTLSLVVIVSLSLVSCSLLDSSQNSSQDEVFVISDRFKSEVDLVCTSIDETALDALNANFSLRETDEFNETLSSAEEEFDKIIAQLTAIDPDEELKDEWETFIDDFTAIRDSFPLILEALNKLARFEQSRGEVVEPEIFEEQQKVIEDLQKEYDMLVKGNDLRVNAIVEFAEEHDIRECTRF